MLGDGVNFRVDVLRCCTLSRNRLIAVKRKKSWIKMTFLNQDIYIDHEMQRKANSVKLTSVVNVCFTLYSDGGCDQNSVRSV